MFFVKNHFFFISFFIILIGCQLQEPNKNHGILFIENRAKSLVIKKSNKNDVLIVLGNPHSKSINDEDRWIYFERVLSKGEFYKLGQNILKKNNILVLDFDKFGVLKNKKLLNIDDKQKLEFSKKSTRNNLTKKSFVENLLQSVKSKMYRDK
tara:strand:+ start:4729 stop:5184 length:456 start_codon:yes stop_codon:yes gene_type:complete